MNYIKNYILFVLINVICVNTLCLSQTQFFPISNEYPTGYGYITKAQADSIHILNLKANIASPTFTGTVGGITSSMVGLGNVPNITFSGSNTGDNAANSLYSGLVTNSNHTGDATGSTALTLATVNSNTGSFGGSTAIPVFTVNGKGLITSTTTSVVIAPAGTLSGNTLASGITASSLTSFGAALVLGTPVSGTLTNCTFPTLNQNTSGSAASLTTARKINFQSFNGTADIINKAIVANTVVVTGTAARTISGAEIVAGDIQQLTGTTARIFTFDTGTNMSAACSSVTVGDTYYILIKSSGTSTGTITLAGAAGMTLSSSAVIAIGTSRMCAIINTGSNAWTIY